MAAAEQGFRLTVRVKPGSARPHVGGRYGSDELVVAVAARPVDGAANEAVRRAVADAFGVRVGDVTVLLGATARTKVLLLRGDHQRLGAQLDRLLADG